MITPALPAPARPLVGRSSTDPYMVEDLDNALRFCGGIDPTLNAPHSSRVFQGKYTGIDPDHFCELDGESYRWCARQPAGGLTYCVRCHIPIFVPPETCLERLEPDAAHTLHHASDLREEPT